MDDNGAAGRGLARRIAWVRCKQVLTVGFVVFTTTILIQNIAYPEAVQEWKRSFRALVGSGIFLMGFFVARVLFEQYRDQIREMVARSRPSGPEQPGPEWSEAGPWKE